MEEIIKRLEIIKSSIAIEDEEIIELQIMKLQKIDIDDDVKKILASLEKSEYGSALVSMDEYLKRYSGISLYTDPEVQGLKLELKSLEEKLQKLVEQRTEILNNIEEFNREYTLKIGSLIEEILALKKEILYKKTIAKVKLKEQYQQDKETYEETQSTIDEIKKSTEELKEVLEQIDEESAEYKEYSKLYEELKESLHDLQEEQEQQEEQLKEMEDELDDERIEEEYKEAKGAYEEYRQEHENIKEQQKDIDTLNAEEKKELKKLYKKAARLCHPDIVADEHKEHAHEIMQALNAAYSKQDLAEVKMILLSLENGTGFTVSSDAIDDAKILKMKIDEIKSKLYEVKSEVEEIQKDETFTTLSELDDWDAYFDELKEDLQKEKERLEEEAREVLEGKKEIQQPSVSQSNNFSDDYSVDELQQIVYKWILKEFKQINKIDLSTDYKAKMRTKDEAKKVVRELIEKGSSSIKLKYLIKHLYGSLDFIVEDVNFETFNLITSKKLQQIVYDWIVEEFKRINQINLKRDEKVNSRVKNEAKKVAVELIKKGRSAIQLPSLMKNLYGSSDFIVEDVTYETFGLKFTQVKSQTTQTKERQPIKEEDSQYSKAILEIQNPNFEKLRRYCNKLVKNNQADTMQIDLANDGRMYKAFVYDALEQFVEALQFNTIDIIDWGSGQGVYTILILDYIREKQLDIHVGNVTLIDSDATALSRAMAQVAVLAQENTHISSITIDKAKSLNDFKLENRPLHIFANEKISMDLPEKALEKGAYYMCLSNDNKKFVQNIYAKINSIINISEIITNRKAKVGRFKKYEIIFKSSELSFFDINEDEIPF